MHLVRPKEWKARLWGCRPTGGPAGDQRAGPGSAPAAAPREAFAAYSLQERRSLLDLARQTVREVVVKGRLPSVDAERFSARLREPKGSFVTLKKLGVLRGCIGHLQPQAPLFASVRDNARSAATRDPRFPPVAPAELDQLEFEISVLTEPVPLDFGSPEDLLAALQPHRDGVVLRIGDAMATYLPQVWEQLPDKVRFLSSLAEKAGCGPDDWRRPGTRVLIYQVEAFS